ncbi:MAG: transcriptional regulator [Nitriliruptorales bacterium]|nr:transcriptional regulator [Nitriliruptorales bacterium]
MSYAEEVGAKLRRIRKQKGFSLQDVERESDGQWKAAVVGSYERGDRNISASKLCELAEFYDVSPAEVLPSDDLPRPIDRSRGLVIDISQLDGDDPRWDGLRRFCESIQLQRGDYNRQVLSIRGDDVRALAVILDTTPDQLVDTLEEAGVLIEAG